MAGSNTSRGKAKSKYRPMSEINVTPFVDVMLVLLIIFMVTAPLLSPGVLVNLPETDAPPIQSSEEALTVTIDSDGRIFLQETEIGMDELIPRLKAIAANGYDERVYVRGDEDVDYGQVMKVMGKMSDAGFTRIGLITDPDIFE